MIYKRYILFLLCVSILLLWSQDYAYAYIDPGSGSYLFQIMLASLVGAAFALKSCWLKIKDFLKRISHRDIV